MNLLIVDDIPTNLKLLRAQLEAEGHTVFEAPDGVDALALLERQPVDAVISDILMPRMDGYRLCHEIRKHPRLRDLPVIIYTSTYTSPSDEKLAADVGADKYVTKPASVETLLAVLHEVIAKPHPPVRPGALQEIEVLKEYSERLVAKLEQKNIELEDAHGQLILQATALATAANAILITDHAGTITWVNPAFTTMSGYTAEEAIGQTPRILKSGQHDAAFYRDFWKTISSGQTWRGEFTNRRKDGSLYYDEHTVTPVKNAEGKITHYIGIQHDVTAHKRAETGLRASEEKIRLLLDSIAEGFYSVDQQGNCTLVNRAGLRMLGYDEEKELLGQHIHELIHHTRPDGTAYPAPECRMYQAMRDLKAIHADDEVFWRRDRTCFPVEYWSYPIVRNGQLIGAVASFLDLTDRKRAEVEQMRLARRIELLLASTGEGIYGMDTEGRCTFINRAGAEMLGWRPEEIMGRAVHDLMHHHKPDGSPCPFEECPIVRAFRKGEGCRMDTEVFWRQDGTFFPVDYSSYPVRENGVITGAVVTFSDSSARKQLEAQFLRSQRMEAIGSLAGGIAHDLNNALAPVLMASELLKMTCKDAESNRVLDTIYDSAKRGAGMVKQILTFARGSEGDRGVVQPKHLVKEMIDITRHTFPKAIDIRTDVATDTWTLMGNPTQLHQILLNLCVNARDAMPKGGTLSLATGNVRLDATCIQLSPDAKPGPHVLLTVSDTGTGMPPEIKARIFEVFFTTKEPGKGTGLGLSTVNNIVKDHGGFLTVDSAVGKGTTFKVYLPALETTHGTAAAAAPPALPMGHGEFILVVDDEAAIRSIATQTLQAFGYRVVTASDGAQAVGVCAQHLDELQLLVSDMAMPIMDGKATIRAIRTLLPRLPVIVASGSDSSAESTFQQEFDVQAFLRKPLSAEDLVRTVHEVLHGKVQA